MKNKKRTKEKEYGKRTIALSQILIMIIATIAFSWMIGSEVKEVGAADEPTGTGTTNCDIINRCISGILYKTKLSGTTCVPDYSTATSCDSGECSGDYQCKAKVDEGDGFGWNDAKNIGTSIIGGVTLLQQGENAWKWVKGKLVNKGLFSNKVNSVTSATNNVVTGTGPGTTTTSGGNLPWDYMNVDGIPSGPTSDAPSIWQKLFGKSNSATGAIMKNAVWTAVTVIVIQWIAKKYASDRNLGDIKTATYIGAGVGMGVVVVWAIATIGTTGGPPGWIGAAAVALAYGIYMLVGYQNYAREIANFRVGMWQPPEGGSDCSKCNSLTVGATDENACSEYICRSYGLACEWKNDETEYETCIEVQRGDVSPPVITPVKNIYGEDVFSSTEYDYRTSTAGTRIIYNGEGGGVDNNYCVPAFTSIKLAFKTNENSNCKINIEPTAATGTNDEKFGTMKNMQEGTSYTINHTLTLPSSVAASESSLENSGYQLTNHGTYKFYIRCEDVRGNINTVDYTMQFCVQSGPDWKPAEITGTNPTKNSYIRYGVDKIEEFEVYTNEPADCKWDTKRTNYKDMTYTFERCSQNFDDRLVGFDFGCRTNLTNFKDGVENKYYVACLDQPELKGTAKEAERNYGDPEEIIFKGTRRLIIQNVEINGKSNNSLITGPEENTNVEIKVTTFGGAEDGKARCLYSEDLTEPRTYSIFENEDSEEYLTENTQSLYMPSGDYKFFLECYDVAENVNLTMINFSVRVDSLSPTVVRVYKDEDANSLKLITDEVAECVYSNLDCTYVFEEGTEMDSGDGKEHSVEWNSESDFYIKCKDEFNNKPDDSSCSITVRPFNMY